MSDVLTRPRATVADPVRTLLDAQEAYLAIQAELARLGGAMGGPIGDALRHAPASLALDTGAPRSLQDAALSKHHVRVDAACPEAAGLQPLLALWQDARTAVHHAWRAIPARERARLKPPVC